MSIEERKKKIANYEKKIEEEREQLTQEYMKTITDNYKNYTPGQKQLLARGLESLILRLEERGTTAAEYDSANAIKIRQEAGYSVKELVKKLGFSAVYYSKLEQLESTARALKHPCKNKFDNAYMGWLREQGYNPFKLGEKPKP